MPMLFSYRDDPAVPTFDDSGPVAVMDAECAVCSWGARMIHRLDHKGTTRICPIQTPLGAALLAHYGLDPKDPTSWLFLDQRIAHECFEAVLHAGRSFGGLGHVTLALRIFPKPIREWLYRRLASNRYALLGRAAMCALPDAAFQRRLLG